MASAAETTEFGYIVHPTDFSEASAQAFHHALRLAVAARAHFYLVHVASTSAEEIGNWSAFPGVRSTLGRWGLLPRDAAPAAVYQQLGVRVTKAELQHREPVDGVLRFLADNPCDFMVLAPDLRRDRSGRSRHSVSLALARRAHLPCLFLPVGVRGFVDGATGTVDLGRNLLATENGVSSGRAASMAWRIADGFGCSAAMLHLLEHGAAKVADASPIGAWPESRTIRIQAPDASSEVIGAQAAAIEADLIVLATRGHNGVLDQLRGDGIEQLLQATGRPLLTVPSD
jgi:nucleotide-binding universal stress UspA family protein